MVFGGLMCLIGSTTKTMTQYIALFDNILHRMRFPKFLMVVKYDLGHEVGDRYSLCVV